jgi:hypothetical protein
MYFVDKNSLVLMPSPAQASKNRSTSDWQAVSGSIGMVVGLDDEQASVGRMVGWQTTTLGVAA